MACSSVMLSVSDHLGDAVDVGVGNVHGAADIFDRGLGRHGAEGDDLRYVLAAVFLRDVVDHFAAAVHAEIDVDIGHRNALGIEEALEEQLVLQRIDRSVMPWNRKPATRPPIRGPAPPECCAPWRSG
jgi:hypothetical protein